MKSSHFYFQYLAVLDELFIEYVFESIHTEQEHIYKISYFWNASVSKLITLTSETTIVITTTILSLSFSHTHTHIKIVIV